MLFRSFTNIQKATRLPVDDPSPCRRCAAEPRGPPSRTMSSLQPGCSRTKVTSINRDIHPETPPVQKHFGLFQTVQYSKIIWDPRAKTKGLLRGHLNIRSVNAKTEQLQTLVTGSNLDLLCLSDTWLTTSSPVAGLHNAWLQGFFLEKTEIKK